MKKVITMGEIMLRLTSPGFKRFSQADEFDVVYGGGEANVAISLANYGYNTHYVTRLPKNEIAQCAIQSLNKYGVKTDYIARGGDRMGIYFLETGASMRASKVVYDRANTAISTARAEHFDFDAIFKDAEWFHFTGITPALSEEAAILTEEALKSAKKHGVTVSVDLNYRKKLWTPARAKEVMTGLMKYVDVCIGNEEDAELVLGFKPGNTDVTSGDLELDGYKDIFKQMKDAFGFKYVVTTLRESHSASDNGWSALIYNGKDFYHSKKYDVRIVDRVGGGDSFAGGLICGLLDGKPQEAALEFAVAASALKHTIPGDANLVTREEVETLAGGDASGRVQR
ncbi:MAG: PfkB family carbohydrate kinase [Fusobacteriaceae bacterium]